MATEALTRKKRAWTDEELEALPKDGYKYELLDGELIMSPAHARHGEICMRLGSLLFNFVDRKELGKVYDSSTGFRLAPEVLLSPDVSFVNKARLKKILIAPDKFLLGAPDLAMRYSRPVTDCDKSTVNSIATSNTASDLFGGWIGPKSRCIFTRPTV